MSMLQAYVSSVSDVLDICFKCVYLDVAYVVVALPACSKYMFQIYVASGLSGSWKSRFECCIYCYAYTRMFQSHISSVSSVSDVYYKCFI
jgi:hypothetical protein